MTTSTRRPTGLSRTTAGGFTAQTWDIAGNEANFFIRDVTGGSKLPFRIRPGAPTSSIDINAAGNVGFGTASPASKMHVVIAGSAPSLVSAGDTVGVFQNTGAVGNNARLAVMAGTSGQSILELGNNVDDDIGAIVYTNSTNIMSFRTNNTSDRMVIDSAGNVGIGAPAPTAKLHTSGTVRFQGVAGCGAGIQSDGNGNLGCLASSRQFKNITGELPSNVALANIMALRPQTGSYKATPEVPEHWLIAEDVAAVDPALAGLHGGAPHVVKT